VPSLDAIGIVSTDLAASIRFYGLLGVTFPAPEGDHVEAVLPNGLRVMLDTLELIKKLDPEWTEPKGHRMNLAFLCADPAEVDPSPAELQRPGRIDDGRVVGDERQLHRLRAGGDDGLGEADHFLAAVGRRDLVAHEPGAVAQKKTPGLRPRA